MTFTFKAAKPVCSIDGCGKKLLARGWCVTHYTRWRERGDVNYKPWKRVYGTGSINTGGHVRMSDGGKHRYQHQLIAEKALGRRLKNLSLCITLIAIQQTMTLLI